MSTTIKVIVIINNALNLKVFIHQTMQSFLSTLLLAPILDPCSLVYDVSQLVSSSHTPDSQTNHLCCGYPFLPKARADCCHDRIPAWTLLWPTPHWLHISTFFIHSFLYLSTLHLLNPITISCTQAADNWGD